MSDAMDQLPEALAQKADRRAMEIFEAEVKFGRTFAECLGQVYIMGAKAALSIPVTWSQKERDGMAAAFRSADGKHGHYETLFSVAGWLLRHRASQIS